MRIDQTSQTLKETTDCVVFPPTNTPQLVWMIISEVHVLQLNFYNAVKEIMKFTHLLWFLL